MNYVRAFLRNVGSFTACAFLVLLGFVIGAENGSTLIDALNAWDGRWYQSIAENGYAYHPEKQSNVAFFPVYPLLSRFVGRTFGNSHIGLLIVAQANLLFSLFLFDRYLYNRNQTVHEESSGLAVWSLALYPTSFFFFMEYSESTFLLICLLAFYAMIRRWPLFVISSIIGVATGARPVGVSLMPVFAIYIWQITADPRQAIFKCLLFLPLSMFGLLAYAIYLYSDFGDPLAFAKTQQHWGGNEASFFEKIVVLLALEPFWRCYLPDVPTYWGYRDSPPSFFASIQAMNPILFGSAIISILYGWRSRVIDIRESVFASAMLAIPYVTRSFEMGMASHGRFVLPVFPVFIVYGKLLMRQSFWLRIAVLAVSGFLMMLLSAMRARGYCVI